jgi:hypothetical protein
MEDKQVYGEDPEINLHYLKSDSAPHNAILTASTMSLSRCHTVMEKFLF